MVIINQTIIVVAEVLAYVFILEILEKFVLVFGIFLEIYLSLKIDSQAILIYSSNE